MPYSYLLSLSLSTKEASSNKHSERQNSIQLHSTEDPPPHYNFSKPQELFSSRPDTKKQSQPTYFDVLNIQTLILIFLEVQKNREVIREIPPLISFCFFTFLGRGSLTFPVKRSIFLTTFCQILGHEHAFDWLFPPR